jgi:hypothetical protein
LLGETTTHSDLMARHANRSLSARHDGHAGLWEEKTCQQRVPGWRNFFPEPIPTEGTATLFAGFGNGSAR